MATADKLTLSQRMAQARERTVEARNAREAAASTAGKAQAAAQRAAAPAPLPAPAPAAAAAKATAAVALNSRPAALGPALTRPLAGVASAHRPQGGAQPASPAGRNSRQADHHAGNAWQVRGMPGEQLMLMPGQMHFGGHAASLRTLLGSCVAVTIWHPVRKLGGMCHFLLPSRTRRPGDEADGRYGDEALEAMVSLLRAAGTSPSEYQAHLCGGADTMPEGTSLSFNVGERNIEQGFSLVDRYGFEIQGVDVGEDVPRTVTLVLATGEVDMRRGMGKAPALDMAGAARRKQTH